MQKTCKMIETLAYGFSSESTRQEPFNEYHVHDRVWKNIALALEGLKMFLHLNRALTLNPIGIMKLGYHFYGKLVADHYHNARMPPEPVIPETPVAQRLGFTLQLENDH